MNKPFLVFCAFTLFSLGADLGHAKRAAKTKSKDIYFKTNNSSWRILYKDGDVSGDLIQFTRCPYNQLNADAGCTPMMDGYISHKVLRAQLKTLKKFPGDETEERVLGELLDNMLALTQSNFDESKVLPVFSKIVDDLCQNPPKGYDYSCKWIGLPKK
jgi:hypothetical protein